MKSIFHYMDYREYLKAEYAERKKTRPAFSYRFFSRHAGFASPNFLKLIMDGKRNLSTEGALKVARALKLHRRERRYFAALVQFNQATDLDARRHYYEQLLEFAESQRARQLEREQYAYLSHWYCPAILELASLSDFREDPQWIAAALRHEVVGREVKEALTLLQKLGLLSRDADGRLRPAHAALTTGEEARSLAAYAFHEQVLALAKRAIRQQAPAGREFAAMTMALSPEQLRAVKEMIREFRRRILHYLEQPQGTPAAVYQFGAQLFALSEERLSDEGEKGQIV